MPFRFQKLQPHAFFFPSLRSDRIVFVVLFCLSAAELQDGKPDTLRHGLAKDDVHRRIGGIVCAVRRSIFLEECMNKKKMKRHRNGNALDKINLKEKL